MEYRKIKMLSVAFYASAALCWLFLAAAACLYADAATKCIVAPVSVCIAVSDIISALRIK